MRRLMVVLAGGALAMLAAGAFSVAAAAWLAPVFLLRASRAGSVWTGPIPAAVVHGVAFALAWRGTFGIPMPAFVAIGIVFFAPYAVDRVLARRLPGLLRTLPFPTAWVAFEFALSRLPILGGQPLGTWGAAAYSQADVLPIVQLVSITGIWGLTFLMGWVAAVVSGAWERGLTDGRVRRELVAAGALVSVILTWGGLRLALAPAPEGAAA